MPRLKADFPRATKEAPDGVKNVLEKLAITV